MKEFIITLLFTISSLSAMAQLYVPGEKLNYRLSYRAALFPNTEVAQVTNLHTQALLAKV